MSQRPSQTQNRDIPDQEGVEAEEGKADQGGDNEDDTPVTQHAAADEEIGDTGSNSLDLAQ
jgi:hypothetical protein